MKPIGRSKKQSKATNIHIEPIYSKHNAPGSKRSPSVYKTHQRIPFRSTLYIITSLFTAKLIKIYGFILVSTGLSPAASILCSSNCWFSSLPGTSSLSHSANTIPSVYCAFFSQCYTNIAFSSCTSSFDAFPFGCWPSTHSFSVFKQPYP